MTIEHMQELPINESRLLPAMGSWPEAWHVFNDKSAEAIRVALAAQRPLLVRGEPGTGKSQLARAAAHVLGRLFVSEVVHARSESQDLQWHFDAVARLGDAQALGAVAKTREEIQEHLKPVYYLSPGVLWWVFDWVSANHQYDICRHKRNRPQPPDNWAAERGAVLLIDEIDKADADLPNGLLETLGNGAFSVPYLDGPVRMPGQIPVPLVVITTNEERELPGAFVRRCVVLQIVLPKQEREFIDWLVERGACHQGIACSEEVRRKAAEQLWGDRQEALRQGQTPPGQAEYLDLLRALHTMRKTEAERLELLDRISEFVLRKMPANP
ncbi:MAG: MoxR family ATPase [Methylococcaceae bacterium]|nr:MoxR family ATPase [Methylococcaceae bacterium]